MPRASYSEYSFYSSNSLRVTWMIFHIPDDKILKTENGLNLFCLTIKTVSFVFNAKTLIHIRIRSEVFPQHDIISRAFIEIYNANHDRRHMLV